MVVPLRQIAHPAGPESSGLPFSKSGGYSKDLLQAE